MKRRILAVLLLTMVLFTAFASFAYGAEEKGTGLYKEDGTWKYYKNGKFTQVTGAVRKAGKYNDYDYYYVEKGVLKKVTGLVKSVDYDDWYYVVKGKFSRETGVVQCVQPGKSKGKWYYVSNGYKNELTGLAKYLQGKNKGKMTLVKKGKPVKGGKGIYENLTNGPDSGRFYYINKGKIKKITKMIKTTVTRSGGYTDTGFFYLINGRWANQITGEVTVGGKSYDVLYGKYIPEANGFYAVEKLDYTYNPRGEREGYTLYMIENGKIKNFTGKAKAKIVKYDSKDEKNVEYVAKFSVKNGKAYISKSTAFKKTSGKSSWNDNENVRMRVEVYNDQFYISTYYIPPMAQ